MGFIEFFNNLIGQEHDLKAPSTVEIPKNLDDPDAKTEDRIDTRIEAAKSGLEYIVNKAEERGHLTGEQAENARMHIGYIGDSNQGSFEGDAQLALDKATLMAQDIVEMFGTRYAGVLTNVQMHVKAGQEQLDTLKESPEPKVIHTASLD